jgi:hypothetical protein
MKIAIVAHKLLVGARINTGRTPTKNLVASAHATRLVDGRPGSASC